MGLCRRALGYAAQRGGGAILSQCWQGGQDREAGVLPPHKGQHRGSVHWALYREHSWCVVKMTSNGQQREEFKEGNLFHSLKGHPSS